jgi:hypothetical protein
MTFRATIREIDNGFLVEQPGSKLFDYSETLVQTFDSAIALVIAKYAESHPSVTLATPLRVPEKAPKKPLLKEPSEGAIKYSRICGLVSKHYNDFLTAFTANFPGQDVQAALEAAHCKVVEGEVVFVGG